MGLTARRRQTGLNSAVVSLFLAGGLTGAATPASATVIRDAAIEIVSSNFPPGVSQIVNLFLHQLLDDNRGAIAIARTDAGEMTVQADPVSFFQSTDLVEAYSDDPAAPATAASYAQNSWRSKKIGKFADGRGAYGYAGLAWKGTIVMDTDDPVGSRAAPLILPDPEDVTSAELFFDWAIEGTEIDSGANGSGDLSMFLELNGETAFAGGAAFNHSVNDGETAFSGDLVAYQDQFQDASYTIAAPDLTVSGSYRRSVDYQSFYDRREVDIFVDGSISGSVAGVPLPAGLLLSLSAMGALGLLQRRRQTKRTM